LAVSVVAVLGSLLGVPAAAAQPTAATVAGVASLQDVTCATPAGCLAVGFTDQRRGAVVMLHRNGANGRAVAVPGTTGLEGVACPTSGSCLAVGQGPSGALVVPVDPATGTPGAAQAVSGATGLYAVACPTASQCLAVGSLRTRTSSYPFTMTTAVFVVITNGQASAAQPVPGAGVFGIACPTSSRCLTTVGAGIGVLSRGGQTWTATVKPLEGPPGSGYPDGAISCPSASTCSAAAAGFVPKDGGYLGVPAIMDISADGDAGPARILSNRSETLNGISCVAVGTCTLVGLDDGHGLVIKLTGGTVTSAADWANVNYFSAVSCINARVCVAVGPAVDGEGAVAWTG